jgi:hypothetical protein
LLYIIRCVPFVAPVYAVSSEAVRRSLRHSFRRNFVFCAAPVRMADKNTGVELRSFCTRIRQVARCTITENIYVYVFV